jgi:hypothetical protein
VVDVETNASAVDNAIAVTRLAVVVIAQKVETACAAVKAVAIVVKTQKSVVVPKNKWNLII